MPQSNPQAEIQNILTDVSSVVAEKPHYFKNGKRPIWWVIVVVVLIALGILLYIVIFERKVEDKGLSREEKLYILNELKTEGSVELTRSEQEEALQSLQSSNQVNLANDPASSEAIMNFFGPQAGQQSQ